LLRPVVRHQEVVVVAATDGIAADPGGGEPDGVERVVRAAGDQAVAKSYRQFGRVGLLAVHDQRKPSWAEEATCATSSCRG